MQLQTARTPRNRRSTQMVLAVLDLFLMMNMDLSAARHCFGVSFDAGRLCASFNFIIFSFVLKTPVAIEFGQAKLFINISRTQLDRL